MKRLFISLILLCLLTGCGTAPAPEAPQPPETVSPVYTDWSKLTPYSPETAETKYTYFEPYSGSGLLQPSDNYGPLLVYVGANIGLSGYITDRLPLYGLVTTDGQLVTAPVYASLYCEGPFLLLAQGEVQARHESPDGGTWVEGDFLYTIAASDGSWVREPAAYYNLFLWEDSNLVCVLKDGSVQVLNSQGEVTAQFPRSAFEPYLGTGFQWTWDGGPSLNPDNGVLTVWQYWDEVTDGNYNVCYLDLATSTVSPAPPDGWISFSSPDYVPDDTAEEPTLSLPEYSYLDRIVDDMTGRVYYYGCRWEDESAVLHYDLLDENGGLVLPDISIPNDILWRPLIRAGLVSNIEDNCFCYYSLEDGSLVFRYPLRTNSD